MPANRYKDWLRQAEHDLEAARANADAGVHDWVCFIAQKATEKALNALILNHGGQPWGHSLRALADLLPDDVRPSAELLSDLSRLDRYYVPTRYPNGLPAGAPADAFGAADAQEAIRLSHQVLRFVQGRLSRPRAGGADPA